MPSSTKTLTTAVHEKRCFLCGVVQSINEFHRGDGFGGRRARCRNCVKGEYTREQRRRQYRSTMDKLKDEIIAAYGGICFCCGESNSKFLTLDHSRDDGTAHRESLGIPRGGGKQFYCWLRRHGFPQDLGLRVACWNCNCGRQYNPNKGVCPHEEERQSHGVLHLVA